VTTPLRFDLVYMQALTGGTEVIETDIPAEQGLSALITTAARAHEWGPGATFYLVNRSDPLHQVRQELRRARERHAPLHSAHEAYAVILEELDEVKAEVWKRELDRAQLRRELLQLAAMAIRAIEDLEL
jgi:hypothetical protein